MELLRLLSTNEIVAQIVSFLILFFLLRMLVWKRFLNLLDQRREKIAADYKQVDDLKTAVEQLKADYQEKIRTIEETARQKIQEATVIAEHAALDIKKKANEDAQRIIDEAKAYTKYELAKAKEQLRDQVADLVVNTMERVSEERLTAEDDRKLVESFIKDLEKTS